MTSYFLENANILFVGTVPSGASPWSIQCPKRMSGLQPFPAPAGPKGRESKFF